MPINVLEYSLETGSSVILRNLNLVFPYPTPNMLSPSTAGNGKLPSLGPKIEVEAGSGVNLGESIRKKLEEYQDLQRTFNSASPFFEGSSVTDLSSICDSEVRLTAILHMSIPNLSALFVPECYLDVRYGF